MRVPSRARGARRRRLELPSSSLARPPRFYVSTAGLARGEGFTPRAVDTRLWVARRRRRKFFGERAGTPRKCIVTSGGPRRKDFDARGHPLGGVDTRARYSPRARARPSPDRETTRDVPVLGMHSPDRVPTPPLSPAHRATDLFDREERGVPSAGATGIKPSARAENAAPPSPSSSSSPSSHSSPPWCTTISTRTTRTRDACATSAWSSRSTKITARPITIPINANADNDCRDLKTRRAARWTMWTELKRARGFSREVGAMGSAASAGESCRRRSRMMQRGSRGRWVPGRSRGKEEGAKDGESREDARGAG